ncbi:hypothetical protein HK102_000290 [Quaeritorhiza haematococci]|nr:hypothetical protein HK102_000290 [Quaeritorhiza haematococci]
MASSDSEQTSSTASHLSLRGPSQETIDAATPGLWFEHLSSTSSRTRGGEGFVVTDDDDDGSEVWSEGTGIVADLVAGFNDGASVFHEEASDEEKDSGSGRDEEVEVIPFDVGKGHLQQKNPSLLGLAVDLGKKSSDGSGTTSESTILGNDTSQHRFLKEVFVDSSLRRGDSSPRSRRASPRYSTSSTVYDHVHAVNIAPRITDATSSVTGLAGRKIGGDEPPVPSPETYTVRHWPTYRLGEIMWAMIPVNGPKSNMRSTAAGYGCSAGKLWPVEIVKCIQQRPSKGAEVVGSGHLSSREYTILAELKSKYPLKERRDFWDQSWKWALWMLKGDFVGVFAGIANAEQKLMGLRSTGDDCGRENLSASNNVATVPFGCKKTEGLMVNGIGSLPSTSTDDTSSIQTEDGKNFEDAAPGKRRRHGREWPSSRAGERRLKICDVIGECADLPSPACSTTNSTNSSSGSSGPSPTGAPIQRTKSLIASPNQQEQQILAGFTSGYLGAADIGGCVVEDFIVRVLPVKAFLHPGCAVSVDNIDQPHIANASDSPPPFHYVHVSDLVPYLSYPEPEPCSDCVWNRAVLQTVGLSSSWAVPEWECDRFLCDQTASDSPSSQWLANEPTSIVPALPKSRSSSLPSTSSSDSLLSLSNSASDIREVEHGVAELPTPPLSSQPPLMVPINVTEKLLPITHFRWGTEIIGLGDLVRMGGPEALDGSEGVTTRQARRAAAGENTNKTHSSNIDFDIPFERVKKRAGSGSRSVPDKGSLKRFIIEPYEYLEVESLCFAFPVRVGGTSSGIRGGGLGSMAMYRRYGTVRMVGPVWRRMRYSYEYIQSSDFEKEVRAEWLKSERGVSSSVHDGVDARTGPLSQGQSQVTSVSGDEEGFIEYLARRRESEQQMCRNKWFYTGEKRTLDLRTGFAGKYHALSPFRDEGPTTRQMPVVYRRTWNGEREVDNTTLYVRCQPTLS